MKASAKEFAMTGVMSISVQPQHNPPLHDQKLLIGMW